MSGLTPEQIAEIATKAALAAVQAATGGASAPPVADQELADDAAEEAAARAVIEQNEKAAAEIEAMADELIPHLMQARHLVVFQWSARARGVTVGGLLRQIVRAHVASETPSFREAQGGGGNSSRNIEVLSERLPVRK